MTQCSNMAEAETRILDSGINWYNLHRSAATTCSAEAPPGADDDTASPWSCHYVTRDVDVGNGVHLHEARYFRGGASASEEVSTEEGVPLVLLHGFGAGIGIFYAALPALRELWPGPLIALDWHGCSLSTRSDWTLGYGNDADVQGIEDFFLQPLERWRSAQGFQRIKVMGHSIGGYLASCYAERYPKHVEQCILASPAGITQSDDAGAVSEGFLSRQMWSRRGINPLMSVWKLSTVIGRGPLRMWFKGFPDRDWINKGALTEYHYQSTMQGPISGAHCITGLLDLYGNGRRGHSRRLSAVGVPPFAFVFGDRDHFFETDAAGMRIIAQALEKECTVVRVARAGHDMMVDNPIGFARAVAHLVLGTPVEAGILAFDVPESS